MNEKMRQHYLQTSVYTDVGPYREFILSLPDDIPSIGMLICDQITHPSMYLRKARLIWKKLISGSFRLIRSTVSKMKTNCISRQLP